MTNKFKENWNKVDEKCLTCHNTTKVQKGLTKQNLKKLFSKPTLQDMIVFILMVGCLMLTWFYYQDIAIYQAIIKEPGEFCQVYYMNLMNLEWQNRSNSGEVLNLTNLNLSFNKNG